MIKMLPDLPKKPDLRCNQHHVTRAVCESPITCHECGSSAVVWVNPPAIKCPAPGKVGVKWMLPTGIRA